MDVVTLDRFQRTRGGVVTTNRDLALLRAAFNWAIRKKQIKETPFKIGTEAAISLDDEHARSRRLDADEARALLDASSGHLRAVIEAALETGMRRGEILSLQWSQVQGMKIEATNGEHQICGHPVRLFLPHRGQRIESDSIRHGSGHREASSGSAGKPHSTSLCLCGGERLQN